MANRSDFLSALPRQYKRLISMGVARGYIDDKDAGDVRRAFVVAHAAHKRFKLRQNSAPTTSRDPVVEAAVAAVAE